MARTRTAPTPAQAPVAPPTAATAPVQPATPVAPTPAAHLPARVDAPPPPAIPSFTPKGLEEIGREDIIIPRIAITQPTSKHGTPGHYYDVVADECVKQLEGVVPLKVRKGRVFFEKAEDKEPRCASDDRATPASRIAEPIRPTCAGCPMAAWTEVDGLRKHPKCQETYTLLMVWRGAPYFITFKSTAIGPVKRLLTQLSLQAGRLRKDIFAFTFNMGLDEVSFTVGKAYVPKFTDLKPITQASEVASYAGIYDTYATVAPTFDPPAEAPETGAGSGASAPAGKGKNGGFDFAG